MFLASWKLISSGGYRFTKNHEAEVQYIHMSDTANDDIDDLVQDCSNSISN